MTEMVHWNIIGIHVRFDYIVTAGDVAIVLMLISVVAAVWVMAAKDNKKWR